MNIHIGTSSSPNYQRRKVQIATH